MNNYEYEYIDGQKVVSKESLDEIIAEQTQHLSDVERSENFESLIDELSAELDKQEQATAAVRKEREFKANLKELASEIGENTEAFERVCRKNEAHELADMQQLLNELRSVKQTESTQFYK